MKKPLLIFMLAAAGFAADPSPAPQKPREIPAARQEELSRALLDAKDAQIELMQSPAWAKLQAANGRIQQIVAQIEKEFGAPGCRLTPQKTWDCPKPSAVNPQK